MRALLIVDIQKDYFEGGKGVLFEPEKAAANAKKLIEYFRRKNEPVIYIRHISTEDGAVLFLPGSEGTEIYPIIQPLEEEKVFIKHVPDSFMAEGLTDYLEQMNIKELAVCGMMSHMCIDTIVRSAKEKGYNVTLLEDACTTMDLEWQGKRYPAETVHHIFMASLIGTFATIMKTEEFE